MHRRLCDMWRRLREAGAAGASEAPGVHSPSSSHLPEPCSGHTVPTTSIVPVHRPSVHLLPKKALRWREVGTWGSPPDPDRPRVSSVQPRVGGSHEYPQQGCPLSFRDLHGVSPCSLFSCFPLFPKTHGQLHLNISQCFQTCNIYSLHLNFGLCDASFI